MDISTTCLPSLSFFLFFFFFLFISGSGGSSYPSSSSNPSSPLLSRSLFFTNYNKMLDNFKIFAYPPHQTPPPPNSFNPSSLESLFHTSLLKSPFLTTDADEAHLFYISFPLNSSARSIARFITDLRSDHPHWNRTLGADHFYVSSRGIPHDSNRNIVELKKNSVQISCFPADEGKFIPHKDITLPTITPPMLENPAVPVNGTARFLGYISVNGKASQKIPEFASTILKELRGDPDFLIESESIEGHVERLLSSRFCLFFYSGEAEAYLGMGEALRYGCVPVMISDRPILDLPFTDVLKWSEIAVFVGAKGGVKEVKRLLKGNCGEKKYEEMRELGKLASKHFAWNSSPQPNEYDAFHTVLYQLWLRRHTIRYARFHSV